MKKNLTVSKQPFSTVLALLCSLLFSIASNSTHAGAPPSPDKVPDFCQMLRLLLEHHQQGFAALRDPEQGEAKVGEASVYQAQSLLPGGLRAQIVLLPVEGKKGEYLRIYEVMFCDAYDYKSASELFMKLIDQLKTCLADRFINKPKMAGDSFMQLWRVSIAQPGGQSPINLELLVQGDMYSNVNDVFLQVY